MECTQRLECTQELYETHTEKICPEQIGFLGICGAKHPVLKGPNKIGRDPQSCSIVLNLNSVSRQHAIINVLNKREYMLMDLDSANKTKLLNNTLQPYIPHPLKNGDTVQFGDIFGIFRLLEEDDELPMTQALDIPETPVASKHVSNLYKGPTTVIPESPDVSDRDDSFITPSQPKIDKSKLSNSQLIKPFGKTISIQPVNSPKSDSNRNSSKQSTSLNFVDNPNTSLNESFISLNCNKHIAGNIHEMDTQPPVAAVNDSTDSIYTADTQIPPERDPSPSIHSLNTQLPSPTTDHLPLVRKINDQHEMQFDIYAANKENDLSIFNAETQPFVYDKDVSVEIENNNKDILKDKSMTECSSKAVPTTKENVNTSEEELLFDEIDDECFEEDFNSQKILPDELPFTEDAPMNDGKNNPFPSKRDTRIKSDGSTDCEDIYMLPTQIVPKLPAKKNKLQAKIEVNNESKASKRTARIKSESSTDCEDIDMMPTQKIPELAKKEEEEVSNKKPSKRSHRIKSDSSTDCEDIDIKPIQRLPEIKVDDDVTDCEDDVIEIKTNEPNQSSKIVGDTKFEDMPTQIIDVDNYKKENVAFEDMPTQIIEVDNDAIDSKTVALEDQLTQVIDEDTTKNIERAKKSFDEIISPFKIPIQSPIRVKSRDIPKLTAKDNIITSKSKPNDDHNYYNATQEIYDDLCSQRESSPEILKIAPNVDDEVVPCSVEDYKAGEKFANIERELSPSKKRDDARITKYVTNLSSPQVRDIIGADVQVAKIKKVPSDSSDVESTPKKMRPFLFTDSDLPDSQEIKTNIVSHTRTAITESSSDSEMENYSEEVTPFVHRKKKHKPVAKIDLTKKFGIEKLPEKVLTRQRKPSSKLLEATDKKLAASILKPSYLTEQEDQIDQDIITENIKRLKTYERAKSSRDTKNESVKEDKKESVARKATETKSIEPKEKIKVRIERPKRKDTKSKRASTRKSDELSKNTSNDSLESTSTSDAKTTRTRRTRGQKKENDIKNTEKKSDAPKNSKNEPDNKAKRTNKKREKSKSPELEIRRSKRQQTAKVKKDDEAMKAPKSILKKGVHEQSTVYNISTSSAESPRSMKRSLVDDSDAPSPKRTRSFANNTSNSINNASLRATPARTLKTQRVLFTAFPSEEVKQKLEKLGAVIVTDVLECSVVLTMQVKRTFKLLCAVGLGRPIVGPGWVQACADTHMIVDPWLYLVKDESAEKRFQFSLERTLTGKRNFLKGYCVSSTPSVQPNASEMKLIVECSGGTWKEGGSNWICVSCHKDQGLWPSLRKRGATIVSTEFILGGVLRQKLDIATNKFN